MDILVALLSRSPCARQQELVSDLDITAFMEPSDPGAEKKNERLVIPYLYLVCMIVFGEVARLTGTWINPKASVHELVDGYGIPLTMIVRSLGQNAS